MEEAEIGAPLAVEPWTFAWSASPLSAPPRIDDAGGRAPPADPDTARQLQGLAFELTVAEARERQRIAHALHDEVGQLLAMAQFRLSELRQGAMSPDGGPSTTLEDVRLLLCQAAQATRAATFELHSPVLQQLGLVAAVQGLAHRLQRTSPMQVEVIADPACPSLDEAVSSVLFRIVRELGLNAHKHAAASHLWITIDRDGPGLRIHVRDDGKGFDPASAAHRFGPEGGFGLLSAQAQMKAIGGRLDIESAHGRGTTVTLVLGPGGKAAPTRAGKPGKRP